MAISHVKSDIGSNITSSATIWYGGTTSQIANVTDLVRPQDWNSVHNQFYTLSGNTTVGSTASGTNVVLSAAGGVTLGGSTDSIVISMRGPMSTYEPFPMQGGSTALVSIPLATSASLSVFAFQLHEDVSAGAMNMLFSFSTANSSGSGTYGFWYGLYTRGTGTNSTTLGTIASSSFDIRNSQVGGGNNSATVSWITQTAFSGYGAVGSTTSSNSAVLSQFTGGKLVGFPVNLKLTAGNYWLGLMATNSSVGSGFVMRMSYVGAVAPALMRSLAPMGSLSTAYSTGGNPVGRWLPGHGLWTSAGSVTGMPASVALASISAGALTHPYLMFWST